MDVKLMYNPFWGNTKLYIDGELYKNKYSRLYAYLNTPIEKWIENNNESYKSWNGFFVELVDELNDDVITFAFLSDEKYFAVILEAFENQKRGIIQKGFDMEEFIISFQNIYKRDDMKAELCDFVQKHLKKCKTQFYMEEGAFIYKKCQELNKDSDYYALYERILAWLEYGKKKAFDKEYWNDLITELTCIYDGKGRNKWN